MEPHNEGVRATELGITRLLWIFAALSLVLLGLLAVAPARSWWSEWRATQNRYNRLAAAAKQPAVPVGIQQIWRPELDVVDRCGSCHLAAAGAAPVAGDPLFAAHPALPHDARDFGCTTCHGGDGRATTAAAAHGRKGAVGEPLIERGFEEAGCGACHSHLKVGAAPLVDKGRELVAAGHCAECHHAESPDGTKRGDGPDLATIGLHGYRADWHARHVEQANAASSGPWTTAWSPLADDEIKAVDEYLHGQVGAPHLMAAKRLAYARGCLGCHRVDGVGGDDGPDLSNEGNKRAEAFDWSRVDGPHTPSLWLERHFLDPAHVVAGSQMPRLGLSDDEARSLTLWVLSLRARQVPESLAPRDRVRALRLGERDFAGDGASLFGVFCAACHGPRGEGRKFATLVSTFPAIGEPEFLSIADDTFLRKTLDLGRPGRRMPAWGTKDGGLRPEEADAVVGYLRSLLPAAPKLEEVMAAPVDAKAGAERYASTCAPCHGGAGEGSKIAPPLAAPDDPATKDDSRIYGTVTMGVSGTAMGAFRQLDEPSLRSLIAHVRSMPPVSASRAAWKAQLGDATRGSSLFTLHCARCHGPRGEGKTAPAIGNPAFLAAATDGYLAATIVRGRGKTEMPHFGVAEAQHPALSPDQVADLVAHIRTLGK